MVKPHTGGIFSRGILVTRSALHLGIRAADAMECAKTGDTAAKADAQRLANAALVASARELRKASRD